MSLRGAFGLALAVIVGVLVLVVSGGTGYTLRMNLPNADDLVPGSQVKEGGVVVGSVAQLNVQRDNRIQAVLSVDESQARVGRGVSAAILSSNLIGSEYVALTPGDGSQPVASGYTIPSSRVQAPVDLDQVLDVLDPLTRERLLIILNEAGIGLAGHGSDLRTLLGELPSNFSSLHALLGQLMADNSALGSAVDHSDRFITELTAEHAALVHVIDAAASTMTLVARRHQDLLATLDRAPGTLSAAHGLLVNLDEAAQPLTPVARDLQASAPLLTRTLAAVPEFTTAAEPALTRATTAAPLLTDLALSATPVVRSGAPVAGALATFATTAKPLSHALDLSIDNLLGVVEAWARAIQTRDGIGHIFNGSVVVGPAVLTALQHLNLLAAARRPRQRAAHPSATPHAALAPTTSAQAPSQPSAPVTPTKPTLHLSLPPITLPAPVAPVLGSATSALHRLLGYLLGR